MAATGGVFVDVIYLGKFCSRSGSFNLKKNNNEFRKINILRINQFYALALGKLRRPYRLHCGESRSRFLDVTAVFPLI